MIEITSQDLTVVSGAGDVNWVQVGRDVVTTGAVIAGVLSDLVLVVL